MEKDPKSAKTLIFHITCIAISIEAILHTLPSLGEITENSILWKACTDRAACQQGTHLNVLILQIVIAGIRNDSL